MTWPVLILPISDLTPPFVLDPNSYKFQCKEWQPPPTLNTRKQPLCQLLSSLSFGCPSGGEVFLWRQDSGCPKVSKDP